MTRKMGLILAVGVAASVVILVQKVHSGTITCQSQYSSGECVPGSGNSPIISELPGRDHLQRHWLSVAYAHYQMAKPDSQNNSQAEETPLRRGAALGLSWLVLLGGLLVLAKGIKTVLARWRGTPARADSAGSRAFTRALACGGLVVLVGVPFFLAALPWQPPPSVQPLGLATEGNQQAVRFTSALAIGGSGTTQIGGTAIDRFGFLYVTGGFTGTIVCDTTPPTTLTNTADYDFFVAKYDPFGRCLWARVANGATTLPAGFSLDGGLAVAVDRRGNAYVGGGFVGELVFKGARNDTVATLSDSGPHLNFEEFVAKYDTEGTLVWAQGGHSGSPQDLGDLNNGINGILDIQVDRHGAPYVVGSFSGTHFLGTPVSGAGKTDALVARLDPATGAPVWVSLAGGIADDSAWGLAIDGASHIYVIGAIRGKATFPTVPPTILGNSEDFGDTFIVKYDRAGTALWAQQLGGLQNIGGSDLAVNQGGDIYLTGDFEGPVTIGSTTLTAAAGGYLAKLDTDGQALWAREFHAVGERVTLDGAGNPHLTGIFSGQAVFGGESPATSQTLTSLGGEDQFIAQYDEAGDFRGAKGLVGSSEESEDLITSPEVQAVVLPTRLVYDSLTKEMRVSGDFSGTLTLDAITLRTPAAARYGFVAGFRSHHNRTGNAAGERDEPAS